MNEDVLAAVRDADRLTALERAALLDTPREEAFDRLTRLATRLLGAQVALVSLVAADRQFFKSSHGLTGQLDEDRGTPLSHSFCQYVVASAEPLVVSDARENAMLRDNGAIRDYDVIAYMGVPITTSDGQVLGSFCAIENAPRAWSEEELGVLRDLTASVVTEIELRVDIAERRRAEAALAAALDVLGTVVQSSPLAIIAQLADGSVSEWNPAAEALFGWSRDEVMASGPQHVPADARQDYDALLRRVMAGESFTGHSARAVRRDGGVVDVAISAAPMRADDGTISGMVAIYEDVGARREVERMKDEFLSVVSHELRTPLTSIRGALGLIAGGQIVELPARASRMVEIATQNADRLVRLINEILDLERIESGSAPLELQPVSAESVIEQTIAALHGYADQAGVRLEGSGGGLMLHADPDRIVQVLTNLIGNAVKFSTRDGVVHVSAARDGDLVRISVRDHGRGIPAGKLESIFERFRQVDSSDAREKGGTGLGLAICRTIVQQHGGRIWAESDPGQGSTFHFTIPQATG